LLKQYKAQYQAITFPKLLVSGISNEDKETIKAMLKKPWMLYVQRPAEKPEPHQLVPSQ
jgi:hypothetical protein